MPGFEKDTFWESPAWGKCKVFTPQKTSTMREVLVRADSLLRTQP